MDGCEILPPDRWFISLLIGFQDVSSIQGGAGFLPPTVVGDRFLLLNIS